MINNKETLILIIISFFELAKTPGLKSAILLALHAWLLKQIMFFKRRRKAKGGVSVMWKVVRGNLTFTFTLFR
jgi:hypothetical protein